MLLIQQSPSFRAWTSRALMVYFRRALLFLVVSSHQNLNNNLCILQQEQQQQQVVYFSDAEDDEDILMIDDIRQSKCNLLKEYGFKNFSRGLNNSMTKSINTSLIESSSINSTDQSSEILVTEHFEPYTDSLNQGLNSFSIKTINNGSIDQHQQTSVNDYNQVYTLRPDDSHLNSTNSIPSYPSCPPCLPSFSLYHSSDDEISSFESNQPPSSKSFDQYSSSSTQQNLFFLSDDDENNIYEKYQTSFSHILHQTKSLHTIRKEDKLESMLVLEPNTSIITVSQLTNTNINYLMVTSNICVRLIANRIDLTIQCNTKPIGCKKSLGYFPIKDLIQSTSIHNVHQDKSNLKTLTDQSLITSNKKFPETSILIDLPYKILYID